MNIIFIGFMGVGKGSVAREFSKKSGLYAIDTDDIIESLVNKKIKNIFAEEGEEYFRALEKKTAIWLEKNVNNSIISTGGGFLKQENLKKIGLVIYLEASFETIVKRIYEHPNSKKKIKKRPLLQDIDKAKELYNIRTKEYAKLADYTLSVENKELNIVVDELDYLLRGIV